MLIHLETLNKFRILTYINNKNKGYEQREIFSRYTIQSKRYSQS